MNRLKKTTWLAVCLLVVFAAPVVSAQEESEKSSDNETGNKTQEISEEQSFAEIAAILEEINQKLEKMTEERREEVARPESAPDRGFGGGSYWPFRIYFRMNTMNDYLKSLGSYDSFPMVAYPLFDGGGGTFRLSINKYFQFGSNFWWGGFSSLGQQHHQDPVDSPDSANITVDENGDGLDDYYTYASYDVFYWSFLAMGKIPLHKRINIVIGGQVGIGEESFGISRNERQSSALGGALGIINNDSDWSRMLFISGGWTGIQWNVGDMNIFKIGLDVGFDYHVPMHTWMPGPGVHTKEQAPPEIFNGMNLNIGLNMQFHF